MDTVYLLRHGIRLDVDDPVYCAHYLKRSDDVPLSARGNRQAWETADFLRDRNIGLIYASPFFRALQTAHPVAETLGLSIKVENGFMEMLRPETFGGYPDILPVDERAIVFPRVDSMYQSCSDASYPELDFETSVVSRVNRALQPILGSSDSRTILIVGHGRSVEAVGHLLQPGSLRVFEKKMCALNKYTFRGGIWRHDFGTTEHLTEETVP